MVDHIKIIGKYTEISVTHYLYLHNIQNLIQDIFQRVLEPRVYDEILILDRINM